MATRFEIHKNKLMKNIIKQENMLRKYVDITDQELYNKSISMRMSQQTIRVRRSIARRMFGYDELGKLTGKNQFETYKKSLKTAYKPETIATFDKLFNKGTLSGFISGYTGSKNIRPWLEATTDKLDLIGFTIINRAKERGKSREDYKELYGYIQKMKQQLQMDIIEGIQTNMFTFEEFIHLKELLQQKYEGAKLQDEDYVTTQMTTDLVEIFSVVYDEKTAEKYTEELMKLI